MPRRSLISQRRAVSSASRDRYVELWATLAGAARAGGSHAWHFASSRDPSLFVEFLEFAEGGDPRGAEGVSAALASLAREIGSAEPEEEWVEP